MSGHSSPRVVTPRAGDEPTITASLHSPVLTRTVAIIKTHALQHRFDIEPRITEAGFEIIKERQMEFDVETDPDTLVELFGEDAGSFAEGPVWVYILERTHAVETWQDLMGDTNPEVARDASPTSLRALYGLSAAQNAVMGSPDYTSAEIQIASLFASSPPFPTTDLPDGHSVRTGSLRSVSSSVLSALRSDGTGAYAASSAARTSTTDGDAPRTHKKGRPSLFKARPVPATNASPSIQPRTSRAAALRAGLIAVEETPGKTKSVPRAPISRERLAQTFADVPGHGFRTTRMYVASTAPPAIAPRMTKAASLRIDKSSPGPRRPRASTVPAPKKPANGQEVLVKKPSTTFEGVPGHKRRESIAVASTRAPVMAPRLNKASSLRAQKDAAPPPSSFARAGRMPGEKTPSLSRQTSRSSMHTPKPQHIARAASVSALKPPGGGGTAFGTRAPPVARSKSQLSSVSHDAPTQEKPKPRPRPSSINPPSVAPRQNRAAELRAAKMALQSGSKPPVSATIKADRRRSMAF